MFKKMTLLVAAGTGYVLGAKAGKERYTQIETKFREIAGLPAVQSATATVVDTATSVADSAKAAASEKVSAVADKAKGKPDSDVVVDLAGTGTGAGPRTTAPPASAPQSTSAKSTAPKPAAPMAGAAASTSAPDVTRA